MDDFSHTILVAILGFVSIELAGGVIGLLVGILTIIYLAIRIIKEIKNWNDKKK